MGTDLSVASAYALSIYEEYEHDNAFANIANHHGYDLVDGGDEWVTESFRLHLGLPEFPEYWPALADLDTEGLSYQEGRDLTNKSHREWKESPDGLIYEDIRSQILQASEAYQVRLDLHGEGDYVQWILYYVPSYACGYSVVKNAITPSEVQIARQTLLEYAKILKIDDYYDRIGRDITQDLGFFSWASC